MLKLRIRGEKNMAITIMNVTQNRNGFEDRFVDDLSKLLAIPNTVTAAAGNELMDVPPIGDDSKVVAIVAHACSDGDETSLDLGFDFGANTPSFLTTPDLLAGLLPTSGSTRFLVFYCACSALSPATLAANSDCDNVVGSIASDQPVEAQWLPAIANLLSELHSVNLIQPHGPLMSQMQQIINDNETIFKFGMGFRFFPNLMVTEEG